jgi:hypothetical protein
MSNRHLIFEGHVRAGGESMCRGPKSVKEQSYRTALDMAALSVMSFPTLFSASFVHFPADSRCHEAKPRLKFKEFLAFTCFFQSSLKPGRQVGDSAAKGIKSRSGCNARRCATLAIHNKGVVSPFFLPPCKAKRKREEGKGGEAGYIIEHHVIPASFVLRLIQLVSRAACAHGR